MKNKLNPKLWSGDELKPEIKEKLLEIARHFYDFLKIDAPIIDIRITGSNSNFTYTPNSDIDLHLHFDFKDLGCSSMELAQNFFNTKKDLYNAQRNITIKGHKVELYSQDIGQPHHSTGEFSILFDKWVKRPKPQHDKLDNSGVLKLSRIYQELIDDVTQLDDDELKLDLAKSIKKNVVQKRKEGLKIDGELSKENLLFKRLRNSGFHQLFDAISKSTDKQLSLEQFNRND